MSSTEPACDDSVSTEPACDAGASTEPACDAGASTEPACDDGVAPGQVLRRHLVTDIPRFERPSGRAPKGKEWDFQTGKWQSKTREKTREEAEEKSVSDAAARPTAELVTEADGLRLHLACTRYPSRTGYKGVSYHPTASKRKPFCVVVRPEGTGLAQHVGYFATPVEAAVAYARVMALHGRTVEALRQEAFDALQRSLGRPVEPVVAELDGVRLHLSKSTCTCQKCGDLHSPYEGVSWSCTKSSRQQAAGTDIPEQPYIVKVDGARLGSFATATEAAACYARYVRIAEAEGHAAAVAEIGQEEEPEPEPEPELVVLSDDQVRQMAAEEGLALLPSKAESGFKGVTKHGNRWRAQASASGNVTMLGPFGSAMEAALAYARHRATLPPPPPRPTPMALAEAERLALAEGLTLVLEPSNLSGFKGVCETRNGTFAASARTGPRGTAEPRYLGTFGSAAEAALAVARHMGAEACEAAALQAGAKRISSLQSGVVITPRPRPPPGLKRNRTKRAKPDVTQLDE